MKSTLLRVLLLVFSVAVCITAMEWTLRLTHYGSIRHLSGEHVLRGPHPTRGWALIPGRSAYQRSMDYAVQVDINEQGLRDRPHEYTPAPGVFRVVVLGDSFMEAYQVRLEQSLPFLLQERLVDRQVEVINLGVGGYGTAQELLSLEEEGLLYRPDLVVLAFFAGNDIQNNSRSLQTELFGEDHPKTFARPYAHVPDLDAAIEWTPPDYARIRREAAAAERRRHGIGRAFVRFLQPTVLANLVRQAVARVAARLGSPPAPPEAFFGWPFLEHFENPQWDEAWRVTRRLILEASRVSAAAGADFAVLMVPGKVQVDPAFRALASAQYPGIRLDETRVNRALAEFCEDHEIVLVDPTAVFSGLTAAGESLYYELEDHHWNALGHSVATDFLIQGLDAQGLLPAGPQRAPGKSR